MPVWWSCRDDGVEAGTGQVAGDVRWGIMDWPGPAKAAGLTGPDAVLQVTDTGVGIPPDDLPHIFERFWRGRDASRISGSGIGLAMAAELTQAHGGRLAASSEPGQGTRMTLTLPAA